MSQRRSYAVAAVLVAVVLVASASGCNRHEGQQSTGTSACAAPPFARPYEAIDPCSPDAVLTAAADKIFTYDPGRKPDSSEALVSAAPLMAPTYLERVGTSATAIAPITSATWDRWASHRVIVAATSRIAADDHPSDSGVKASRVVAVTLRPGDEPAFVLTVYMQATRDGIGRPWLVTELEVR